MSFSECDLNSPNKPRIASPDKIVVDITKQKEMLVEMVDH